MANHIHIHFVPRSRARDQAPGSVPPSGLKALVEALHEALAAREGRTNDADFDESKVKRSEGGQFSAQQHGAKAAEHTQAAAKSQKGTPEHAAHSEAAAAHTLAAQHITSQTGWASHQAAKAMQASQKAAATAGPANLDQLKATASNPKASVEERAAAVGQLDKMEKSANAVAASPHAVPSEISKNGDTKQFFKSAYAKLAQNKNTSYSKSSSSKAPQGLDATPPFSHAAARAELIAKGVDVSHIDTAPTWPARQMLTDLLSKHKGSTHPAPHMAQAQKEWESKNLPQAAGKPTSAKATATKAATHELLSTGHPFSIDELMKATGAKSTSTLMTALSDLKSEKYAGKLGKLNITKRPDGMYHVQGAAQAGADTPKSWGKPPAATAATTGGVSKHMNDVTAMIESTGLGPPKGEAAAKLAAAASKAKSIFAGKDAPMSGPSGRLPARAGPGGFDVGMVQNIQATPAAKKPDAPDHAARSAAHAKAVSKYSSASKNMPPAVEARHQELLAKVSTPDLVANPYYSHAQAEKQARLDVFRGSLPGGKLPIPSGGPSTPNAGSPPTALPAQAPDHTALHEVLKTASAGWAGQAMNPAHVEAAAKYMAGKKGVDILKLSDATGLSVGASKHLNTARLAHFKNSGGSKPFDKAEFANNYFKQKWVKMPSKK